MRYLSIILIFLATYAKAQVPDIYLQKATIDSNINGLPIAKGDTIDVWVMYKSNNSTTRTIYFDFQYNYRVLNFINAQLIGTSIPQGAQTNLTSNYYPDFSYRRTSQNTTRNGNTNYYACEYNYQQNSSNAIHRIYTTISSNTNLVDGSFMRIRMKVNQTSAGTTYDSLYMNFAAIWDKNGNLGNSYMPDPKSTWVQLANGQNELLKANIYPNASISTHINVYDSASNHFVVRANPDVNGNFSLSNELMTNTTYKLQIGIDSLKNIAQSAISVSDATAVLSEFGNQNLDGTYNNSNLFSGASWLASDINYNKKLDGGDPYIILSHVAGIDSLMPKLYLMNRDTFNTISPSTWANATANDYVYFKTSTSAKGLQLNYLIAGDVNRSHSSQVVDNQNNIKAFSFVNTPHVTKTPINVNLNNVVSKSDYISIPFNISSTSNICGLQFELSYDATLLQVDTIQSNTNASWLNFFKNENGMLKFGGVDKTLSNPLVGNVMPYIVRFKALKGGSDISTYVNVTTNMDASDNKGNQLGINLNSSTIRIIGINKF